MKTARYGCAILGLGLVENSPATIKGGTPVYMSPEQAAGNSDILDGRSDMFSLGVVLYELLTGKNPFRSVDVPTTLRRIQDVDAPPCRLVDDRIPKQLEDICVKALQRPPGERYRTALDFAIAMEETLTYTPQPIDVSHVDLTQELYELTERLAEYNHDAWAQQRISEGWTLGDQRNDELKLHPDLVPYELLSEGEKEYDRITVITTLKAITALGYEIRRSSP